MRIVQQRVERMRALVRLAADGMLVGVNGRFVDPIGVVVAAGAPVGMGRHMHQVACAGHRHSLAARRWGWPAPGVWEASTAWM